MSVGDIGQRIKGKKSVPIDISYPLGAVDNTSNNTFLISGATAKSISTGASGSGLASSSIAIGYNSVAENSTSDSDGSIVIGSNGYANRGGAIHIGHSSNQNYTSNQIYGVKGANGIGIGTNVKSVSNAVAIGYLSSVSTTGGIAIGQSSAVTATNAISIGVSSAASGSSSIAIGYGAAIQCTAASSTSVAIGNAVTTDFVGELAFQTGSMTGLGGDAKVSWYGMMYQTTNATPTELGTGSTFSTTPANRIVLINDSSYLFDVDIVARNTATDTESKVWNLKFGIRRGTSAANTALIGTPTKTIFGEDTGTSLWDVTVTADTTNGRPNISVTGEAAKTIRWMANVRQTKVTG